MSNTHLAHLLQEELDLSSKIASLEERADRLDQSFSAMYQTARTISEFLKRHVNKVELERKSWDVVERIFASDNNARDVLDHVKIFFNFLIAKMKSRGAEITDVKMLWHLHLTDGVNQIWKESLTSFGFKTSDLENIRLLLAVIYKLHTDMERRLPEKSEENGIPREYDTEINDCIRYISSRMEQMSSEETDGKGCQAVASDNCVVKVESNGNADEEKSELDNVTGSFGIKVDRKLLQGIAVWNVDPTMKDVVMKMVSIVVYTMNVGRVGEILTIVPVGADTESVP